MVGCHSHKTNARDGSNICISRTARLADNRSAYLSNRQWTAFADGSSQSVGGFVTIAMAIENPDDAVAAINFADGTGGDAVKHPGVPGQGEQLEDRYMRGGKTTRVPMLWICTENDRYFNPTYSSA